VDAILANLSHHSLELAVVDHKLSTLLLLQLHVLILYLLSLLSSALALHLLLTHELLMLLAVEFACQFMN